ncbi:dockerin type I repeat-containing protein [Candidatus Woesearchaeota archaeon]|nr:dockerin type I repeat-containing protein [Candidatus Woesearchaeota archaeon]
MPKEKKDFTNFFLVAIVGIVAVVGIVVMLVSRTSAPSAVPVYSEQPAAVYAEEPAYAEGFGLADEEMAAEFIYDEEGNLLGEAYITNPESGISLGCTDFDNTRITPSGLLNPSYYVKAKVVGLDRSGKFKTVYDYCWNSVLMEAVCSPPDGNVNHPYIAYWSSVIDCPFGCFNGACVYPKPPCGNYGDIDLDGKITSIDMNVIIAQAMGRITLSNEQKSRADVDGDGQVKIGDATLVYQLIYGKIKSFPVC